AKGYDPRDYCLVAFGAAAPQHACAVAADLGIIKILIHPDAGVLSALGTVLADVVRHRTASIYRPLSSHHAPRDEPPAFLAPSLPPSVSPSELQSIFNYLDTPALS